LQDLRRNLYVKAKAEPTWRFWGLYVHVCKTETISEAYERARSNNGAPGIDGVTFEAIEESGVERFLEQIRDELVSNTYRPMRARKKEIRPRLEVGFEDRLQNELECPLDYSITDCRDGQRELHLIAVLI
jgi:hypothetical protein